MLMVMTRHGLMHGKRSTGRTRIPQRISCQHHVNKKRNTIFGKNFGGCMNTTNLDKIKELTEALKESIKWLECTEDGTDEQIRRIFGQETVDMLNRHRNIVEKTSEVIEFPWAKKQGEI